MKLAVVVVAVLVGVAGVAVAGPPPTPPPPTPPPTIDDAIQRSKAEHKPLVVEFYTDWCKPCHIFEQTTLVDPRVQAAIGSVVFVRYDAEAEPGVAAASRYHVASYPTFLAVDKGGVARRTVSGIAGDEAGVEQFLAIISDAATTTLDEADIRARVAASPSDATVRLAAGRWYAERGAVNDALGHFDAVAGNARASEANRASAGASAARLRRVTQWKKQLVAEKLDRARRAPATVAAIDLTIATVDSGATPAEVHDVIGKVLAATSEPSRINSLLYIALAAGAKDEALAAGKRVLATTKEPAMLDTLAECYHVHGDRSEALRVEDQAIALDTAKMLALAPNRARFDSGKGDAQEVIEQHARAARVWKQLGNLDSEATEPATSDGPGMPPEVMAALTGIRKLGETLSKTCAPQAGKSDFAYARITLDAAGKLKTSSVFLDATGTSALRACLTKNLAQVTLPVVPGLELPEISISFKPEHSH